jgi:hypothetical protein
MYTAKTGPQLSKLIPAGVLQNFLTEVEMNLKIKKVLHIRGLYLDRRTFNGSRVIRVKPTYWNLTSVPLEKADQLMAEAKDNGVILPIRSLSSAFDLGAGAEDGVVVRLKLPNTFENLDYLPDYTQVAPPDVPIQLDIMVTMREYLGFPTEKDKGVSFTLKEAPTQF